MKKILISQPKPTSEKSPYFDIEKEFGVEFIFRSEERRVGKEWRSRGAAYH